MSLFGRIRATAEPIAVDDGAHRRVSAARACRAWTEIDVDRLVRRERGWLVDAESDAAYRAYGGDAFSPSGMIVADMTPLFFFVADDDVHVLAKEPRTWTEITYSATRGSAR